MGWVGKHAVVMDDMQLPHLRLPKRRAVKDVRGNVAELMKAQQSVELIDIDSETTEAAARLLHDYAKLVISVSTLR